MAYARRLLFQEIQDLLLREPRIQLTQISALLAVERHTLEKAVRSTQGVTFRDYQKILVLIRSLELLRKPCLSIKEIAYALGYQHPQDFSFFFRKTMGESPCECRQKGGSYMDEKRVKLESQLMPPLIRRLSP